MGVDRSNKWVDRFTVTGLRWTSSLFPTITIGFYSSIHTATRTWLPPCSMTRGIHFVFTLSQEDVLSRE